MENLQKVDKDSSSLSSSLNLRFLNEAWDQTKEKAKGSLNNAKVFTKTNTILSITVSSIILSLLILCLILKWKCTRQAHVLSKAECDELVKRRQEKAQEKRQRAQDRRERRKIAKLEKRESSLRSKEHKKVQKQQLKQQSSPLMVEKGGDDDDHHNNHEEITNIHPNISIETRATTDESLCDIESGNDGGVEMVYRSPTKQHGTGTIDDNNGENNDSNGEKSDKSRSKGEEDYLNELLEELNENDSSHQKEKETRTNPQDAMLKDIPCSPIRTSGKEKDLDNDAVRPSGGREENRFEI